MKVRTEHDEQKALVQWFDLQFPKLRGRLAACPNGGHRNKVTAGKLKAEGVRKGFPDLNLLVPRHGHAGLFIELKRARGGKLEPEQSDWLDWLNQQGFMAVVCKGFDAARDTIKSYLGEAA
ncbi:VRR-NUC domain protein [compost metagenome]